MASLQINTSVSAPQLGWLSKHVSHWIEPQCPCSDEPDGGPFTGFLPFPDPTFLPVFPGIIFQIRHTYCIVIAASALGVCHFRSFLPKSYSFSCIFPVLQDPALPSQTTPAHSLLSSDIPPYIRYILSCLAAVLILSNIWWSQGGQDGHITPTKTVSSWLAGSMSFFNFYKTFIYFTYLIVPILVAAHGIFDLCGMWDLIPWPGIKPRAPALGARVLAAGPQGKSWYCVLHLIISLWAYSFGPDT